MGLEVENVKYVILSRGLDDWVHIAEVASAACRAMSGVVVEGSHANGSVAGVDEVAERRDEWLARNEREALPIGIAAVKELLRDGSIRIGEMSADGFVPWSGSVEEIESRIDTVVQAAEFPLLPGHLFWVENTSVGDEVIRRLPGREDFRGMRSMTDKAGWLSLAWALAGTTFGFLILAMEWFVVAGFAANASADPGNHGFVVGVPVAIGVEAVIVLASFIATLLSANRRALLMSLLPAVVWGMVLVNCTALAASGFY